MLKIEKNKNIHQVQVITRASCLICDEVITELEKYKQSHANIKLSTFDIEKGERAPKGLQSFITPATWVDRQLWYLGGIDLEQFDKKIKALDTSKKNKSVLEK